jgi:hypothetical protein
LKSATHSDELSLIVESPILVFRENLLFLGSIQKYFIYKYILYYIKIYGLAHKKVDFLEKLRKDFQRLVKVYQNELLILKLQTKFS